LPPAVAVCRQEYHSYPVLAASGQLYFEILALPGKETVGDLDQDSGAIASVHLAATSAAVFKIQQNLERFWDYCIRPAPLGVDNKTHSTGVMLECRIV
jgi:hypothetical protein